MTTKVKQFHATSRISFKQKTIQGDVFYTFEYSETVDTDLDPVTQKEEYEIEKQNLWNRVDEEINKKCKEILQNE